MGLKRSPLAPTEAAVLPPVGGVRMAAMATGQRYRDRDDLLLMAFAPATTVAGVLTRSLTAAAPVHWCRRCLSSGRARALVVNAGNANAFTGRAGDRAVEATARAAAVALGVDAGEVLVSSTGVIGEPLPEDVFVQPLDQLAGRLEPDGWPAAAGAIRTTDTFSKGAATGIVLDGKPVQITGIAKGSGMIAPDMATMLAFIATDAEVAPELLQAMTRRLVDRTFNAITVDGDTSTNDTVLVFATGRSGAAPITDRGDRRAKALERGLEAVMRSLAQQIVRDGEGASKFVTITVTGARSPRAARRIGLAIANSPLVKTAIAGEDANWGRIIMAIGKSGEAADPDRLALSIGGIAVTRDGMVVDGYDEAPVARHMTGREIEISVDLGLGRGRAEVWTCDLTHGYIDINADYRS